MADLKPESIESEHAHLDRIEEELRELAEIQDAETRRRETVASFLGDCDDFERKANRMYRWIYGEEPQPRGNDQRH